MSRAQGKTINEKLHNSYLELQLRVNAMYDQDLIKSDPRAVMGLRQILEKKEGLFRMHMMGKRVNYACRSVITPDPYLDIDEIGIPEVFATRLTFGEPVNFLNIQTLRKLVRNGPETHPGANFTTVGTMRKLIHRENPKEREAAARLLGTHQSGTIVSKEKFVTN